MRNADAPRPDARRDRLLVVDPAGEPTAAFAERGPFREATVGDLPRFLKAGDVLVVNDAASLPASLPVRQPRRNGANLEIRLAGAGSGPGEWWAVLFGAGSWRDDTEHRAPPPPIEPGEVLRLSGNLEARVESVSPFSPRLLYLRFDRTGTALYDAFYRYGRPVQYSHLRDDLALWDAQTPYGARPWAMEMPSAGRPLTWDVLSALRRAGVVITRLTHAAGLSSTGDAALDAHLPLPERYEIPADTVNAVAEARSTGGRVLAVGTTVVRALEGNAAGNGGRPQAGTGITDLILGSEHRLRVVDGILTGIHEPGTSHFKLLEAFAPSPLLARVLRYADDRGFRHHEFGDSMLVLPGGGGRPPWNLSGARSFLANGQDPVQQGPCQRENGQP